MASASPSRSINPTATTTGRIRRSSNRSPIARTTPSTRAIGPHMHTWPGEASPSAHRHQGNRGLDRHHRRRVCPEEQEDTLAVFRWLEDQEWCSGKLGMWGVSWGGFSSLQTAMLRPPQLRAIAPVHATHDRFACDVHYTEARFMPRSRSTGPHRWWSAMAFPRPGHRRG